MKITDTRDGTTMEGVHVDTIPAGAEPTAEQLREFYDVAPGATNYDIYRRVCSHDRLILRRGQDDADSAPSYYIVPKYPFYAET